MQNEVFILRKPVGQLEYASLVDSLMYTMHCIRSDIAFAVCKYSKYTNNLNTEYSEAIFRILRYLKKTKLDLDYFNCFL